MGTDRKNHKMLSPYVFSCKAEGVAMSATTAAVAVAAAAGSGSSPSAPPTAEERLQFVVDDVDIASRYWQLSRVLESLDGPDAAPVRITSTLLSCLCQSVHTRENRAPVFCVWLSSFARECACVVR